MAGVLLSQTEKVYLIHGVKDEFRSDGRSNIDYRPMELETDVVSHASGSARLRLANTDILVGVKTEIDVPKPDKPGLGKIEFFVDCSANATPEFEGRGGEQLANSISNMMQRAYQSSQAFDLKQLCIFEGKQCWKLYIDILILECGGNLCDAVSLAVKAALFNTRIPFVKAALMDGGDVDLQLSDDPYDSKLLDVGSAPLLVTLCKIGDKCVVDPTAEEEKCSAVSLIVGITGNPKYYCSDAEQEFPEFKPKCSAIGMHGPGSVTTKTLKNAINQGIIAAVSLDEALGNTVVRERRDIGNYKKNSYGSANATPEFEGRGGEQLANSISNMMQRAYQSSQAFDLKQLCIFEGKQCWKLYIDILILECGGNLCDAVSLAVKAALFNTRIPFVKAALMDGGDVDLQLSDDPYDSKLLDVGSAPLLVTLCKIGDKCVVDPTAEEEKCSAVSLIVGITGNPKYYCSDAEQEFPEFKPKCSAIGMHGPGSVTTKTLKNAINQGIIAAVSLDEALGNTVVRERRDIGNYKKNSYGFLK